MNASLAPDLIDRLIAAAIEAGRAILEARAGKKIAVETKSDDSPVTIADRAAETVILKHLAVIAPAIPVVAEEACAAGHLPSVGKEFFLVDPLDGTKEFIKGGADFTVNIGLVRDRVPVAGIVYAPATGDLYGGSDAGAFRAKVTKDMPGPRQAIRIRAAGEAVDVVASKSHRTPETDAYIARYEVGRLVSAGSSLKFCTVAAGEADLYPRMGTTMQWDTAAGDAVLRAAGGRVVTLDRKPLPYGPNGTPGLAGWQNPWFIAFGGLEPAAP
jgi:3'(2'),5'-bisphosphate nucleotidase